MFNKLMVAVSVGTIALLGATKAYATNPFKAGDFIAVPDIFVGLEVQKHEVTYVQWDALNSELPKENQSPWETDKCEAKNRIKKGYGPNHPAGCISYIDALAFIKALNAQDPDYTYRLFSVLELNSLVYWSSIELKIEADYIDPKKLEKAAWSYPESDDYAHEVCTKDTVFGLCDILGNVWEWTTEEVGDESHPGQGGTWITFARDDRSMTRFLVRPDLRFDYVGFRLARIPKKK